MQELINDLAKLRYGLSKLSREKAENLAIYERQVAYTMISLKNGIEFELLDQKVINPQTTIIEKIARGICWNEKLKADESELMYKSLVVNIEVIKAQLNGYQTIIKYLDEN